MGVILHPWHLLLLALSGWINREQQKVIEYLITENQVLKEKLGKKRILLSDDQRRRLAVKGPNMAITAHHHASGNATPAEIEHSTLTQGVSITAFPVRLNYFTSSATAAAMSEPKRRPSGK